MSEHLTPPPERKTPSDDELIRSAIESLADSTDKPFINDATARMIASQLHGGQASELYSFTSTGAVSTDLAAEIQREVDDEKHSDETREWADQLLQYFIRRLMDDEVEPVEGWNKLWLKAEQPAEALIEKAQALYDANADHRAFLKAFTKDELVQLWAVCGDGVTYSFDDEVFDALAVGYRYFDEETPS